MSPEGLPAPLRLKKRRDFLRAQGKGAKHHVRHFLVFVVSRHLVPGSASGAAAPPTRLGITVTRKVGKAHVRNRIKRLVREVFRRQRHALPDGLDVVFVAKRNAGDSTYEGVLADFEHLVRRLSRSSYPATVEGGVSGSRSSEDRR